MQSKEFREFIGNPCCQNLLRCLRNNISIDKPELARICNLTWQTINNVQKEACSKGIIIPSPQQKLGTINPDYTANFAGIHISDKAIDLSIINFSGKVIKKIRKNIVLLEKKAIFENLVNFIKNLDFSNIIALSISSDEFYQDKFNNDLLHFYDHYLVCFEDHIRHAIPEAVETYYVKTSFANAIKCMDMEKELSKVISVITCIENRVYINIIAGTTLVKKSSNFIVLDLTNENCNEEKVFYDQAILPVWGVIHPDKMILLASEDEKIATLIKNNCDEWKRQMWFYQRTWNALGGPEEVIALDFCPSESTALHAMYNYYGWKY